MRSAVSQSVAGTVVVSALLLCLFVVRSMIAPLPTDAVGTTAMPLGELLGDFQRTHSVWGLLLSLLLVFLTVVNVLSASAHSTSLGMRSALPIQFFVVAGCGVVFPVDSLVAYFSAFMLTVALKRIARSYKRSYSFGDVFWSSFVVGLLPLLYAPSVFLVVVLPVVWLVCGRTLRETVVGVVGSLLPLLLAVYVLWIKFYPLDYLWWLLCTECFTYDFPWVANPYVAVSAALGGMFCVMTVVSLLSIRGHLRAKARKTSYAYLVLLVTALLSMPLGGSGAIIVPVVAVLASMLSVNAFGLSLSKMSTVLYWSFLASTVVLSVASIAA